MTGTLLEIDPAPCNTALSSIWTPCPATAQLNDPERVKVDPANMSTGVVAALSSENAAARSNWPPITISGSPVVWFSTIVFASLTFHRVLPALYHCLPALTGDKANCPEPAI